MSDLMHLVSPHQPHAKFKTKSLKLAPFLICILIYFVFVQDPHGELWTTLLKCAPIVSLMIYILLKGFAFTTDYKYSQLILCGLVFSCAGDVLLNIDLFEFGMGAFAVAQIFYISSFGWKPLKLVIGIPLYLAGAAMIAVVFKSLDSVLVFGLPIYAALLLTMCWRSLARGVHRKDFLAVFCAIGSVLFVISDGLIGVDMFFIEVPHARIWIMTTYYVAQFAIALSTTNECKSATVSPKLSKRSVQQRINGSKKNPRHVQFRD